MKKIFLLVLSLLVSIVLNAQYDQVLQDRKQKEEQRLKYKQKNIRGYVDRVYEFKGGKLSDTIYNYQLINIDSSGNIIQSVAFDKYRQILDLYRYDFNRRNENVISYMIIKNKLLYKLNLYYDLSNKLIEIIETNEFGSVNSKEYHFFNSKDQLIEIKTKGQSGTFVSEGKISYDANGKLKDAIFIRNNKVYSMMTLTYGEIGLTGIKFSSKTDKRELEQNFVYKDGLIVEIKQTENDKQSVIKREYFTFKQKTRNIERWLSIPDYSKYFKKDKQYAQNFKYKTAPQFPKGKEALKDFIIENLKYPKKAKKAGKQGLVIVGFNIDYGGKIGNIRIYKSVDYNLDDAAIELVKKMPKWKPALNEKGKGTMSSFELPINFIIE